MKNMMYVIGSIILVLIGLLFFAIGKDNKEVNKGNDKTKPTTTAVSEVGFTIEDRTQVCAQAIELIYNDGTNEYYLSCMKSGTIYIVFTDGTEITLKNAIAQNKVTMEELIKAGLQVTVKPVQTTTSAVNTQTTRRVYR